MAGISAGGNCWFEQGLTNGVPGAILAWPCLGFLPGSFCPHFDGETDRRPAFHRLLQEGAVKPGLAADDGAALHFIDGELAHVVSSRPEAKAYRLSFEQGMVREAVSEPEVLPAERS
jgi:peptidase E